VSLEYGKGIDMRAGLKIEKNSDLKNNYYFYNIKITRRLFQKIAFGNWFELKDEIILENIKNIKGKKQKDEGYKILYEELLSQELGEFALGIAKEKIANELIKFAKKMKFDGRKTTHKYKKNNPTKFGEK